MTILKTLIQLRNDLKTWVTNNLNALNAKIDEKTIPIDSELSSTSTNPVQNKVIKKAIDNIPTFSGDYNDLTNAPDISEDGSGNMIIADESGNIIFKADAEGIHTTAVSLNGEAAATESYVDDAIANIEFPTTDLTDYATKKYVDDAVGGIKIPEVDFTGYATEAYVDNKVADLVNSAPEALNTLGELATALENHEDAYDALLETVGGKATKQELENAKTELSESIVSETDEFHIVDGAGKIVASIDENGVATTAVTAQSIIVNGDNVEEHIDNNNIHVTVTEKETWNNKSNFSGSYNDLTDKPAPTDLSNYYTKTETDTVIESAKEELSESIVSESEEWHIVDNNGNIVATIDANGISTTAVTAQNITVNGLDIEELIQARVQAYIDEAILGGKW